MLKLSDQETNGSNFQKNILFRFISYSDVHYSAPACSKALAKSYFLVLNQNNCKFIHYFEMLAICGPFKVNNASTSNFLAAFPYDIKLAL